jgi:hypothetical protein
MSEHTFVVNEATCSESGEPCRNCECESCRSRHPPRASDESNDPETLDYLSSAFEENRPMTANDQPLVVNDDHPMIPRGLSNEPLGEPTANCACDRERAVFNAADPEADLYGGESFGVPQTMEVIVNQVRAEQERVQRERAGQRGAVPLGSRPTLNAEGGVDVVEPWPPRIDYRTGEIV